MAVAFASRELADCSGAQLRNRRLSAGSASSADSRKLRGISAVSRPGRLRRLVFASELVTDDGTAPRRLLPSCGTAELRRASRGGAARCCSISLRYELNQNQASTTNGDAFEPPIVNHGPDCRLTKPGD